MNVDKGISVFKNPRPKLSLGNSKNHIQTALPSDKIGQGNFYMKKTAVAIAGGILANKKVLGIGKTIAKGTALLFGSNKLTNAISNAGGVTESPYHKQMRSLNKVANTIDPLKPPPKTRFGKFTRFAGKAAGKLIGPGFTAAMLPSYISDNRKKVQLNK
jgi:hypothetical protein